MSKPKKNVITIVGTTGVGKSQLSIELAKKINGEIINADSMQVYKRAPLITNKHPIEEREGIPHHVMDHVNWGEEYFIHRFSSEANAAIQDIHSRGKTPIIIGGTFYYLQSLLFKNKTAGEKDTTTKLRELTEEDKVLLDGPVEESFKKLQEVDPVVAGKFHPQDQRKISRALEIYLTTGEKASDVYKEQKLDEFEDSCLNYNTLLLWLHCDKEVLSNRLDVRVDKMIEDGALEEIRELYDFYEQQDPKPDCTRSILQVIGFKEFLPWLESGQSDKKLFAEGVERMKIRTRQYSRYQVKWITKMLGVELHKEARFNYMYGGKMYLLDATDLAVWNSNVGDRGVKIAQQFLECGPTGVSEAEAPEHLQALLPTSAFFESFKSNKLKESSANWKHYECPVCKDSEGRPLVAVGEERWKVHENSRRHRKQLAHNERKRHHDEIVAKYKKVKEENEKGETPKTET
ncbi:tRNA dimethylallyltransferase [Candidozyma haemuli]|uniref:tRNA dimethylallyltransferase n=1 Tax=Candidozyma haemuli TaxID=45357 RepID=A0A2V1ASY8_9ASCO|nr:tRNA dimethylallyltransferase [[Candida] haemuloni]PVH20616.1 tRNA dimethylallyltransferase [[Candida] haemuloni]